MISNPFKRERSALVALASDVVADAIKAAVTAAAALSMPAAVARVLGDGTKGFVSLLLKQTSSVERKLDLLLRQPLKAGLILLQQGLELESSEVNAIETRNKKLDEAAVEFAKARATVYNSRSDALLVRSLECIAHAARPGAASLARTSLDTMRKELIEMAAEVKNLEETAADAMAYSRAFDEWLGRDSLRDKPIGHLEQRLLGRQIARYARRLDLRARESRRTLTILEGLTALADQVLRVADSAAAA